jgi:hypothetical protein
MDHARSHEPVSAPLVLRHRWLSLYPTRSLCRTSMDEYEFYPESIWVEVRIYDP